MATTPLSVSQREPYEHGLFIHFLWWLSTAEKEIITDCVIDRNRYSIIGYIVLTTWLFASGAWTYFFSTAIENPWIYIPLGIFMGFIVLCIDRALIKGINRKNRNRFTPFLFRGLLALTIGLFMAQPAILFLFDKEIKVQISLDNETRKAQKRIELDSLYGQRKIELVKAKQEIERTQALQQATVNEALNNYLKEADGTGGTGKVGIEKIALAKKMAYEQLDAERKNSMIQQKPLLDSIERSLGNVEAIIQREEEAFAKLLNTGFLTRMQGLNNLLNANNALRFRYYLIVAILMLIELMPVIVKSLLPSGAYEEKVALREEMEKEMAFENIKHEKELKKLYNSLALENDSQSIKDFFILSKEDRQDKIKDLSRKFNDDKRETFDNTWDKIKRGILSKQEN
ncbi:MAG: DUF4407 domain-containing protein [Chitinophagaceae bacterium]